MSKLFQQIVAIMLTAAMAASLSLSVYASEASSGEGVSRSESLNQNAAGTQEAEEDVHNEGLESAAPAQKEDIGDIQSGDTPVAENPAVQGQSSAPEKKEAPDTAAIVDEQAEEALLAAARAEGTLAAAMLADVEDLGTYEVLLKAVLTLYYSEDGFEAQLKAFTAAADSRAEEMLNAFRTAAEERADEKELNYFPGEVIVVFEENVSQEEATEVIEEQDGEILDIETDAEDSLTAIADIPLDMTVEEAARQLEADSAVAYAQPVFRYQTAETTEVETAAITNDPAAGTQWYLNSVNTSGAWSNLTALTSRSKIRVAVIDTLVDLKHEDLQANVNSTLARNFYGGQNVAQTVLPNSSNSHGTHVTGILAATANNNLGITGVGSGANNQILEIMPINVFDSKGSNGTTSDIARAIRYAANNGVKVINMSLGYEGSSSGTYHPEDYVVQSAVNYAHDKGCIVVCAAGNYGNSKLFYPSDFDNAFGVINLTSNNTRAFDSNYGTRKNISAPGANINSTMPLTNRYGSLSGTSMATPVVSAVAAMVYYVNSSFSASQVESILSNTATDLYTAGKDAQSGWGRVNAEYAVAAAITNVPVPSGLKAVSASYKSIKLTWSKTASVNGYYIFRSTDKVNFTRVKTITSASTTRYTDSNLTTGTTYYYRLIPYKNVNGRSITGYRWKAASSKPKVAAVSSFTAKGRAGKQIKLTWKKISGATGYKIYRATSKSGKYVRIKTIKKGSTVRYTNKGLKSGKKYYYKIVAIRKTGKVNAKSSYSAIRSARAKS